MNPRAQQIQKRVLQCMLAVAMAALVWGLLRLKLDGTTYDEARSVLETLRSPWAVMHGVLRAEPVALLIAGLSLIILTPAIRLLLLVGDFFSQRDWLYVGMSLLVGAIVAVAFFLRLH